MKPFTRAALIACLLTAVTTVLVAAGKQDFVLVNKTGVTINELYVSPSDVDDWEEDVLGQDVLENNQQVKINFAPDAKKCMYDLKVTADGDSELIWEEIDLCKASKVTLKKKGVAEIE